MFFARTFTTRAVSCALLLPLSFILGCSPYSEPIGPPSLAASPARQIYSGEALFRGIAFGQGEVGSKLTEIWPDGGAEGIAKTPAQAIAVRGFIDETVRSIRKTDPTFFERFAAATQSGDHFKVDRAINEAVNQVQVVASAHKPTGPNGSVSAECVVVDAFAVIQYAVAVTAFAVAVVVIFAEIQASTKASNLKHDTLVNAVATNLAR